MHKRKSAPAEKGSCPWPQVLLAGLMAILLLSFGACGQDQTPAPAQPSKPAKQTKQASDKLAQKAVDQQADPDDHYAYDATGKPDPFVPLITLEAATKSSAPQQSTAPLTPLQKYDLSELKLVAIVAHDKGVTAVLEDPAGFGFIVREGTLVGKNEGIIKKITGNALLIEEKAYSALGNLEPRISTLTIKHEK